MKADNVAVRETGGLYYAYYIGSDAPFLDAVDATHEGAIAALLREWKRFRSVVDASSEMHC